MSVQQLSLGEPPEVAAALAQWPYQINSPRSGTDTPHHVPLPKRFPELLPLKPYAADDLQTGLRILTRPHALRRRHIQFNGPSSLRWMLHDIDDGGAYHAHDDAYLPQPNVIVLNPIN